MLRRDGMKPKFWILIAGFSRNFELTIPSLLQRTVLPLKNSGNFAGLTVHLAERSPIAREFVELQVRSILGTEAALEFRTEAEALVVEAIESLYKKVASRGNIYALHRPEALHRAVFFLELLNRAGVALKGQGLPLVFLRADLFQRHDADLATHYFRAPSAVNVPGWHNWQGINDRVAIIPPGITGAYLGRVTGLESYVRTKGIFHPETFLAHSLRDVPIARSIRSEFFRTRDGGRILDEDFHAEPSLLSVFGHHMLTRATSRWWRSR